MISAPTLSSSQNNRHTDAVAICGTTLRKIRLRVMFQFSGDLTLPPSPREDE